MVQVFLTMHALRGPNNFIGDYTYGIPEVIRAYPDCSLTIGKFCSIGSGVKIAFWGRHAIENITTYPFENIDGWPEVKKPNISGEDIVIGNDVWIANNVLIMQGANVGDGAVLGANSVVAGTIPPYSLVVGNPAQINRKRFTDQEIDKLLEIKWWDWSVEYIREHLQVIYSPDIDSLYEIWRNK